MNLVLDTAARQRSDAVRLAVAEIEGCIEGLLDQVGSCVAPAMAREHLASGGKCLRGRLAIETTAALGVDPHLCVPWAAACELIHNASLIHDDLQDGDRMRRGRTALWARHGAAQAINVGDLMLMMPTLALAKLECEPAQRWQLAELLAVRGAQTAAGQAEEIALRSYERLDGEAYLHAARGKTAGLFGMPVEGAALFSGVDTNCARELAKPFEDLGLLYQLLDDVVDIFGDKGRDAPGADVREGKVSALVAAHIELHPADRAWLVDVLSLPRELTSPDHVATVARCFREGGALDAVLSQVAELALQVDSPVLGAHLPLRQVAVGLRERFLEPLGGVRARVGV